MLTRDELVKQKTKEVALDGGNVLIRALTAAEALELRGMDIHSKEIFGLVSKSLIDPLMSAEDVSQLAISDMNKLTEAMFTFNALGPNAIKDAQNELKKTINTERPTQ